MGTTVRDDLFGPWTPERKWVWGAATVLALPIFLPGFVLSLRSYGGLHIGADNALHCEVLLQDFDQEYTAARNAVSGRSAYAPLAETAGEYLGYRQDPKTWKGIEINAHPPAAALLALPLVWLSYENAVTIWSLASLAAVAASGWLIVRQLGLRLSPWSTLPLVTLTLAWNPLQQQLNQGQLNAILLLLIVGGWAAARSGRPWTAGALLGAATAIKLFPGLLLVYFAWRREWRVVAAGAVAIVFLSGVAAAAVGPDCFRDYWQIALPAVDRYRFAWLNCSLTSWWNKLCTDCRGSVVPLWPAPGVAPVGILLSSAALVAVLAILTPRGRGRGREADDLSFGLTVIAMTLLSPITWDHYFLLLLLPIVLLWRRPGLAGLPRLLFLAALSATFLGPLWFWKLTAPGVGERSGQVAGPFEAIGVISYLFYAQLILFFVLADQLWRARTKSIRPTIVPGSAP